MIDYAAKILTHESTGLSPFQIQHGYQPRTSFDWTPYEGTSTPRDDLNRQDAQKMAARMEEVWNWARKNMLKAQEQQKRQADKHRREVNFAVGDSVFLVMKHWNTGRPSRKLDNQMSGPWKIIEKRGHSFKLDLPESMRMNPVFSPDKLRLANDDPLPGQRNEPQPPVEIEGEKEWILERILTSRLHYRKLQYRAKWVDYEEDMQWYPARNFRHAPQLLKNFHEKYPRKPGPPRNLQYWLENDDPEERMDDDIPVSSLGTASSFKRGGNVTVR